MHNPIERAYGIIPLKKEDERWQALVIYRTEGFWEFPKGHAQQGESGLDSARRELKEETGLNIVQVLIASPFLMKYQYSLNHQILHKQVDYYAAVVEGEVQLQLEEATNYRWVHLEDVIECLSFETSQKLFLLFLKYMREFEKKGDL